MSSGPGGSGEGEGFDQTDAETQAQMAEAGLLGSFADPGETGENVDAAFTAMQAINQEPTSLEDYDVTGQIFGIGQPSFAPAGTLQESYLDRAEDAIKGFVDRQTTPSSIFGNVGGAVVGALTGNPLLGMATNQAFQALAEPQDPRDANNPNSPDYTGPFDLSDPIDNGGPDPYARRRYILPTPQTTAPVEPMVNNPLPLTPYDYQKQVWNGNVFTPAPIRRV
tara:strand:- start:1030 stop:1698 length:669 start_codon:yes stop_codon:yes gene_type:complete